MQEQQFAEGDKVTLGGSGPVMVIDWIRGRFACCLLLGQDGLTGRLLPVEDLVRADQDRHRSSA